MAGHSWPPADEGKRVRIRRTNRVNLSKRADKVKRHRSVRQVEPRTAISASTATVLLQVKSVKSVEAICGHSRQLKQGYDVERMLRSCQKSENRIGSEYGLRKLF